MILTMEQQKTVHQSLVTEGEAEDREVRDVSANTKMATVMEVGTPALKNTHADSKPEHLIAPMNNNVNQDGDHGEAVVVAETNRSEPRSSTDPVQVRPLTAFEETEPNECAHREKIQEKDQHNSSNNSTSDVTKATMETQVFLLPAKKKPLIEIFDRAEEMSLAPGPSLEFFKIEDAEQTEAGSGDGNDR